MQEARRAEPSRPKLPPMSPAVAAAPNSPPKRTPAHTSRLNGRTRADSPAVPLCAHSDKRMNYEARILLELLEVPAATPWTRWLNPSHGPHLSAARPRLPARERRQDLEVTGVLVVADWPSKLLLDAFREMIARFFGKPRMPWHGVRAAAAAEEAEEVEGVVAMVVEMVVLRLEAVHRCCRRWCPLPATASLPPP